MNKFSGMIAAVFLLSGCATTHMQSYLGKDMQEVIADSGPPAKEITVSQTRRAFQYNWDYNAFNPGPNSYKLEPPGKHSQTAPKGFTIQHGYLIPNMDMMVGHATLRPDCAITYIAEWDDTQQKWIVVDYRGKNNLAC